MIFRQYRSHNPPPPLTATAREVLDRIGRGSDPEPIAATHAVTPHLVNLHAGFAVAKLHRYVLGSEQIEETSRITMHQTRSSGRLSQ